jgi:hypothetical protein
MMAATVVPAVRSSRISDQTFQAKWHLNRYGRDDPGGEMVMPMACKSHLS